MRINELCEVVWTDAMIELSDKPRCWCRLRRCQAWTAETEHYIFLKSYATIIAVIDKASDTLYDLLRLVYGYTQTSAQHIAKFSREMGTGGDYGCVDRHTYRDV